MDNDELALYDLLHHYDDTWQIFYEGDMIVLTNASGSEVMAETTTLALFKAFETMRLYNPVNNTLTIFVIQEDE